jgi:Cu/Ag efflux protein CusF
MLKRFLRLSILVGCLSSAFAAAAAQEVVHALTGTVRSIDATAKTISVETDDGSEGLFKVLTDPKANYRFDKKISASATAPDTFKEIGVCVIVYYIGNGDVRTVVALQNLGAGPFVKSRGTIVGVESKGRWFTVKDESGAIKTFWITSETVVETGFGVTEGSKSQLKKGDSVQVTAETAAKNAGALFISAL